MIWLGLLTALALADEPSWGGRLEANLRVGLVACPEDCPLLDQGDTAVVGLWADRPLNDAVTVRLAGDVRLHPAATLATLDQRALPQAVPTSLRLERAYAQVRTAEWAVHRLGVQVVGWGVADGVHVADPVNPKDLEDPLALDGRLPVPMVESTLHRGDIALELVWVPVLFPSVQPRSGVEVAPAGESLLDGDTFPDVHVGGVEYRTRLPSQAIDGMGVGARLSHTGAKADVALSAWWGRDSLPQAHGQLLITGFQTDRSRVDVAVDLVYPQTGVFGAEARGELFGGLSGWVEASLTVPERTVVTASQAQLDVLARLGTIDAVPDPLPEVVTQDGQPYPKWVVGLERVFGRVLVNGQWVHGLPLERKNDELHDYGVLIARVDLGHGATSSLLTLAEPHGALVHAEVAGVLGDAVEVHLGAAVGAATETSPLQRYAGLTQVYLGTVVRY